MGPVETTLCDAEGMDRLLDELADRILAGRLDGVPLGLVGIRRRGVPICERLADRLRNRLGVEVPVGAVDITLYRDDLGRGDRWPELRGTEIPFAVDGAEVILVDDVLQTGRTVRAALNTLCDLGRPACVRLAVVADRGGREFPIRADYVGLRCEASPGQRVRVWVRPIDDRDAVVRVAPETA